MTSNSFQFAFRILFNFVYCLRLIKTTCINVIENNSVKMTYSVLIKKVIYTYIQFTILKKIKLIILLYRKWLSTLHLMIALTLAIA